MTRTSRAVLSLVVLVTAGLTACEVPPTPEFTVTTRSASGDAAPGDGVCEATTGAGDCTLQAAIDEGNALGRARIILPDDRLVLADPLPLYVVIGQLTIQAPTPTQKSELFGRFVIEEGASLLVRNAKGSYRGLTLTIRKAHFEVRGSLVVDRSEIGGVEVGDDGILVAQNTAVTAGLTTNGWVGLRHVSLYGALLTLVAGPDAETHIASSFLQPVQLFGVPHERCQGTPPISGGFNIASDGTCELDGPGDVEDLDLTVHEFLGPPAEPPLEARDLIPLGTNGCGDEVTIDYHARARPVDATATGTPACDVGPLEHPGP